MGCSTCGGVAPVCDRCLERLVGQLGGTAAARGTRWGRAVRRVTTGDWPAYDASEKVRAIALRKIADVAGADERLRAELARACAAAAQEAFESDTPPVPGSVSFTLRGGKITRRR